MNRPDSALRKTSNTHPWRLSGLCFGVTFAYMLLLYLVMGFTPFGDNSLAVYDADVQYMDFFAYYKDVLAGENSIWYSFSKILGGSGVAVFSYYLASPLNLLVALFQKSQLRTFFDVMMALKIALAAGTMSVYLQRRFSGEIDRLFVGLLSLCYALMQYDLTNGTSIMWLDGVYLLPLIPLGVYQTVRGGSCVPLALAVGASMLFNWYTGCINCLFSACYLVFEWGLGRMEAPGGFRWKQDLLAPVWRYALGMGLGIGLSAVLFLPTILSLRSGRGGMETELLTNTLRGNPLSMLPAYSMSGGSTDTHVTVFCGSLPLLGCLGFFTDRRPWAQKLWAGLMLLVMVAAFYYQPLFVLFSLMKSATSYYCRYAYLGSFCLILVAAMYFASATRRGAPALVIGALLFAGARLAASFYTGMIRPLWSVVTLAFFGAILAAGVLLAHSGDRSQRQRTALRVLTAILVAAELGCNAYPHFYVYHVSDLGSFAAYETEAQAQIDALRQYDGGVYRVSQTSTREMYNHDLTAYYNDALAHGYASISGYTSDPDARQIWLLHRLGYRSNVGVFNIVNSSVVAADSLLGVKYVFSRYPIEGLEPVEALGVHNGKTVYENPYCLPMAFTLPGPVPSPDYDGDPFAFQNALYSALAGQDTALYVPVPYTARYTEDAAAYRLSLPEGDYALYGNLPWTAAMRGDLNVNQVYTIGYSKWLSQNVFYIPTEPGAAEATVQLETENGLQLADEQFYALDLQRLRTVTDALSAGAVPDLQLENGRVRCRTQGEDGMYLYLSIPDHKGWTVTRNGTVIEPELFAGCMMMLPLTEGENDILLRYTVPGFYEGLAVTAVSALVLAVLAALRSRRRRKEPV